MYSWFTKVYLGLSQRRYVRKLMKLLEDERNDIPVYDLIRKQADEIRGTTIRSYETDVAGYLKQSWVQNTIIQLKPEYENLRNNQAEIKAMIMDRLEAYLKKQGPDPEGLYEFKISRIEVDGINVPVREIARQSWFYILFGSTEEPDEYYVQLDYIQGMVHSTKYAKLSSEDAQILDVNNKELLEVIINKYHHDLDPFKWYDKL